MHRCHNHHNHAPTYNRLQIWRLVTNFLLLGKLSFNFLIRMIWVVQYGTQLESQVGIVCGFPVCKKQEAMWAS